MRHVLNNQDQYVRLGAAALDAGPHRIAIQLDGAGLHPGSGGTSGSIGPLALTRAEAADAKLVRVPGDDWRRLCDRAWDWIERDA